MELSYQHSRIDSDMIYSIDNVRIDFDLCFEYNAKLFVQNLDYFRCWKKDKVIIEFYETAKSYRYHYLYVFKNPTDNTSFSIGFGLNNNGKQDYKGFIDFNPNKVSKWDILQLFFYKCGSYMKKKTIKRYDLAIDIPINRTMVHLVKDRRSYHYLSDRSITEYLGKRNNHNFVKVYDKKIESGLNYDLTRIEITINPEENLIFPSVQVHKYQSELCLVNLSPSDRVMYQLLSQVEDPFKYIQQLHPAKRRFFKELMKNQYEELQMNYQINKDLLEEIKLFYIEGVICKNVDDNFVSSFDLDPSSLPWPD